MSGLAAITASGVTIRSLAFLRVDRCGEDIDAAGGLHEFRHPADAGNHRLVPFLEIDPRPARHLRAPGAGGVHARGQRRGERVRFLRRTDQRTESADHGEDAGKVALVEGMHRDIGADQVGDDIGLQIGEGEHQIGFERQDLRHVGGDEGRNPRLLAPHLRWPHRVARHADDAILLAEQIKRLDGFFGEADDSGRREHEAIIHDMAVIIRESG